MDDHEDHDEDPDPPLFWLRRVADHDGGFQAAWFGGVAACCVALFWWVPIPWRTEHPGLLVGVFILGLGPMIALGLFAAMTVCWRYRSGPWWAFFSLGGLGAMAWIAAPFAFAWLCFPTVR